MRAQPGFVHADQAQAFEFGPRRLPGGVVQTGDFLRRQVDAAAGEQGDGGQDGARGVGQVPDRELQRVTDAAVAAFVMRLLGRRQQLAQVSQDR